MFSLESSCLKIIVKHFHRLNFAFTESKDSSMQRNFKFLQRRYTDYLAIELLEDERNTDEYFNFLMNENLKYLEFDCFRNSRYLDSIDEIFCRLPNLTKVSFSICGDEVLKSVAKFCPYVVEIVATSSVVSDKGFKHLYDTRNGSVPCPKIKNIFLKDSTVTDDDVKLLIQHLPLLEKLEYNYLPRVLHSLDNETSSESSKVHSFNLTEIDLTDCVHLPYFTDVIKVCLTVCPKLEVIYCKVLKREQLDAFKCSNLKKLYLRCLGQPLNVDNFLKVNGHKLNYLTIFNCVISASVLAEHCPALEIIQLIFVQLTNVDAQVSFPNLTNCSIGTCLSQPVKTFNLFFSSSPRLEFLSLRAAILEDEYLIRNGSSVIKTIEFCSTRFEINYLISLLLNYDSLSQLLLRNCVYDVPNAEEILSSFAEMLPNRPEIIFEQLHRYVARRQPRTMNF